MKQIVLFLALALLFTACKKEHTQTYEERLAERTEWYKNYAEDNVKYTESGSYHEWTEPVYTYKEYTGEPHIDSVEFYESLSGCSVWYTPYDDTYDREMLEELVEEGDSMAMLRLAYDCKRTAMVLSL